MLDTLKLKPINFLKTLFFPVCHAKRDDTGKPQL